MPIDPTESDRPAPPGTIDLPVHADSPTAFSSGGAGAPHASSAAPTPPPGGAADERPSVPRLLGPRRQWVIRLGIAATALISVVAVTLLAFRWAQNAEPEATIVVWAGDDEAWDGATAVVEGSTLRQELSHVLTKDENLIVRFHVPPGHYIVRVVKDGKVIGERRNPPTRPLGSRTIWWPFKAPPAATQLGLQ